jgi:hypothetical protein
MISLSFNNCDSIDGMMICSSFEELIRNNWRMPRLIGSYKSGGSYLDYFYLPYGFVLQCCVLRIKKGHRCAKRESNNNRTSVSDELHTYHP